MMDITEELERDLLELGDFLSTEIANTPEIFPVMDRANHKRSICAVLRDIYAMFPEDERLQSLTIEATVMAKKMTKRLVDYRKKELDNEKTSV